MSQEKDILAEPIVRQSVKFAERYVSSALNRKLAGVLKTGVYRGFAVKPGVPGYVLVTHGEDCANSVAVVERNGYNLTITMDDPGYVKIPATGTWYIVIEAFYVETEQGYQRVVARESIEDHHIVIAKVIAVDDGGELAIQISTAEKMEPELDTKALRQIEAIRNGVTEAISKIDDSAGATVEIAVNVIRLSNRVTRLELARQAGASFSPAAQRLGPEGYQLGNVTVAPVTIVPEGAETPPGAAYVVKTETLPLNP